MKPQVTCVRGDVILSRMAGDTKHTSAKKDEPDGSENGRACTSCGMKLSSYNPGPNCWQHTIGNPWRGPSAKPRYD